jgi:hypothetical protein
MIKSTDLHQGMKLSLKGVQLEVTEVKHDKRRTIAVCKDPKGKRYEHTVSDLYYGNAKVMSINPDKKIPAAKKPKAVPPQVKKKNRRTVTYIQRSGGVATVVRDPNGKMNWTSWVRTK